MERNYEAKSYVRTLVVKHLIWAATVFPVAAPLCIHEKREAVIMAETKGLTYIRMMLDILNKKEVQLTSLLELTTAQEQILKGEEFDEDAFTELIAQKREHLRKIEETDNGFQSIYNRVAEEMKTNKEAYKDQILEMQGLITRVTDLGVRLSALEEKNKATLEAKLQGRRQTIRQFKVSKQTADKYYKNMIGMQTGASYFMDQKK